MPSALDMARTVLGQSEGKDRAALMDYLKTGGVNLDPATTAWCAAFVNASLAKAGYSGTGSNLARSFMKWGNAVEGTPRAGDIAVYPRGNNPNQGHVGFVESVDPKTGMVTLLAGNSGDAVSERQYAQNAALGYRRGGGLPTGDYTDGPKGEEAYQPPVTAVSPKGPVEAAGGGAGSEAGAGAPPVAPVTKGKTFGEKFTAGLGDFAAPAATPTGITDLPKAALAAAQPTTYASPGAAGEDPRQKLAMAMARLNAGKLFV
jgi:uncharacterized protein (TIGR02594 family)